MIKQGKKTLMHYITEWKIMWWVGGVKTIKKHLSPSLEVDVRKHLCSSG